jgi:hypothetical protein
MKRTMRMAVVAALTAALGAGNASAHGWIVPGGGSPGPGGAAGGGFGGQAGAGSGSGFGQPGVGGGEADRPSDNPSTNGGGRGGVVQPAGRTPTTLAPKPVGRGGGGTPARRPTEDPFADAIRVRWTPAFLPFLRNDGYAGVEATLDESMRRSETDGGLPRDGRPSLVFLYDAAAPAHVAALRAIDKDGRLRAAATFFNCVRVDAGSGKDAVAEPTLVVFDADGRRLGAAPGDKRLGREFELMEKAFAKTGGDLSKIATQADQVLKHRAWTERRLAQVGVGVVCPDCGELRGDLLAEIEELKASLSACAKALAGLAKSV